MADVTSSTWSQLASNNTAAAPNGWPEGMARSDVNNAAREMMGAVRRDRDRRDFTVTSTGTGLAYALTYVVPPTELVQGQRHAFFANAACAANPTLNVALLGPKPLKRWNGAALIPLAAGDIQVGQPVEVFYDAVDQSWRLCGDTIFADATNRIPAQRLASPQMTQLQSANGNPIPNATSADLIWDVVGENGLGAADQSKTQFTTLTVQRPGNYTITVNWEFSGNTTGQRQLAIVLSNGQIIARDVKSAGTGIVNLGCSVILPMAAGDYVKAQVVQDSGGPLSAGGNLRCNFSIKL